MKNKFTFLILGMFLLIGFMGLTSAINLDSLSENDLGGITTYQADNIDSDSARLKGGIAVIDSDYEFYIGFSYREVDSGDPFTNIDASFDWYDFTLGEDIDYTLTGLDPNSEYEYNILSTEYKQNGLGYSYLQEDIAWYSFTTDSLSEPEISILTAQNVDEDSADLRLSIDDVGDAINLDVGFEIREQGGNWGYIEASEEDNVDSTGTQTYTVTGLSSYTYYDFRGSYAYELDGSFYDTTSSEDFTTLEATTTAPTISLNSASGITQTYATLSASIDSLGDYSSVDVKFYYREQGESAMSSIEDSETTETTTGIVTYNLTGLTQDTNYEYTLAYYDTDLETYVASISGGDYVTESFITLEESFEWTNTTKTNETSSGLFDEDITGLTADTNYTFRACVDTETETICGDSLTFLTNDLTEPSIETINATSISANSAVLNGNLTDKGDYSTIDVQFSIYDDSGYLISVVGSQETLSDIGTWTYTITDLDPETEYTYKAVAYSPGDYYVEGDNQTFTTSALSLVEPFENEILPDITMNISDTYNFNINNYYTYFDVFNITANGLSLSSGSATLTDGSNSVLKFEIYELLGNTYLELTSYEENASYDVNYTAYNSAGAINGDFTVTITEGAETTPEPPEDEDEDGVLTGVFGTITGWFIDIFPDSDDMSSSQKIGFMVVFMFIVSLLIVAITFATTKDISMGIIWFIAIINILLFFFFASIGYVPVGFLVVIGLIILSYGVLKIRARNGGGE
jgi:hypothetical protein